MRAEEVAVTGDGGEVGDVGDEPSGGVEVLDDRDLEEQAGQRGTQGGRALHDVDGVGDGGRQPGPRPVVDRRPRRAAMPARPRSSLLRCSMAPSGGVDVLDGHRVGGGAERGGDRRLVARLRR